MAFISARIYSMNAKLIFTSKDETMAETASYLQLLRTPS